MSLGCEAEHARIRRAVAICGPSIDIRCAEATWVVIGLLDYGYVWISTAFTPHINPRFNSARVAGERLPR